MTKNDEQFQQSKHHQSLVHQNHIRRIFLILPLKYSTSLIIIFQTQMLKTINLPKDEEVSHTTCIPQNINHNGFTNPPPLTQIIPPLIIILSMILTLVEIHQLFTSILIVIIIDILLVVVFAIVCWFWYLATSIIPTDSVQLKHLAAIKNGEDFNNSNIVLICRTCKTYINTNCYHCKKCQRCVQFFDHHCKWLNNCIGAKNYFQYYGLLVSTFILLCLFIGLSSFTLTTLDSETRDQSRGTAVLICSIFNILITVLPTCWLVYLISLHTYLIITKKSTIQLILETRANSKVLPIPEAQSQTNNTFKINFTKRGSKDLVLKNINFHQKQEQLQSSNHQQHLNLNKDSHKISIEADSIITNRQISLPPLKVKNVSNCIEQKVGNYIYLPLQSPQSLQKS